MDSSGQTDGATRPVVLMHIPKTAGTALRMAIERACGGLTHAFIDPESVRAAWRLDPWVFSDASVVSGHFGSGFVDRLDFPHFSVSCLRDPVGRTISHYVFSQRLDLSRLPPGYAARMAALSGQSLETLLASDDPFVARQYRNTQAWYFAGFGTLDPEGPEELDDAELFDRALARARKFDFLGFHHRLTQDVAVLFDRLGLASRDSALQSANTSPDAQAAGQLAADQDLALAIERTNAVDRELYRVLAEERTPRADV